MNSKTLIFLGAIERNFGRSTHGEAKKFILHMKNSVSFTCHTGTSHDSNLAPLNVYNIPHL